MTRAWTHAEDAILIAMARTWSLRYMAPFKGALRMSGFDRRAPDIRDRLLDLELRPLAVAQFPYPTNANAPAVQARALTFTPTAEKEPQE